MLLALKKTQSGREASTPASLQLGAPCSLPSPFSQLRVSPSSLPALLVRSTLLLQASLSISPDALSLPPCLPSLPQLPGLCWSPGSTLTPASRSSAVDQAFPSTHHPTKGAADQEAPPSQVRPLALPAPTPPPKPPVPSGALSRSGPAPPLSGLPSPWVWRCQTLPLPCNAAGPFALLFLPSQGALATPLPPAQALKRPGRP